MTVNNKYQEQSISCTRSYHGQSRDASSRLPRRVSSSVSFGRQNISNIYVRHHNNDVRHVFSHGVRPAVGSLSTSYRRPRKNSSVTTYIRRHPSSNSNTPVVVQNTKALTVNRNFENKFFKIIKLPVELFARLKRYIFKDSDRETRNDIQREL